MRLPATSPGSSLFSIETQITRAPQTHPASSGVLEPTDRTPTASTRVGSLPGRVSAVGPSSFHSMNHASVLRERESAMSICTAAHLDSFQGADGEGTGRFLELNTSPKSCRKKRHEPMVSADGDMIAVPCFLACSAVPQSRFSLSNWSKLVMTRKTQIKLF